MEGGSAMTEVMAPMTLTTVASCSPVKETRLISSEVPRTIIRKVKCACGSVYPYEHACCDSCGKPNPICNQSFQKPICNQSFAQVPTIPRNEVQCTCGVFLRDGDIYCGGCGKNNDRCTEVPLVPGITTLEDC